MYNGYMYQEILTLVLVLFAVQARPLLKEKNYPDLIDPRILDSHDVHQLFWMVRVAEKCLSKDPHKRLTMDKVYHLSYIVHVRNLCYVFMIYYHCICRLYML